MTNLEKAKEWFTMNEYEVHVDRFDSVISVGIDENLMVEISDAEVKFRAELWEEAVKQSNEL